MKRKTVYLNGSAAGSAETWHEVAALLSARQRIQLSAREAIPTLDYRLLRIFGHRLQVAGDLPNVPASASFDPERMQPVPIPASKLGCQ
jgi:hypothetical protein